MGHPLLAHHSPILHPPSPSSTTPITIAFLARHGPQHNLTPSEIPSRANVAALKKLGVRVAIGFSAVGSLREEVKPRDFVVAGGVVDWTKGLRGACSFFGDGVVGHVGMGEPFDRKLSGVMYDALSSPADREKKQVVLQGEGVKVHDKGVVICIEGPQFSTRSESQLYRSFPLDPPINCVNMSAVPECKLFREAEIAYALLCMSTDYDSWRGEGEEGVSVEMVMGHMVANGENAKRAVGAILEALGREMEMETEASKGVVGERLRGTNRGAVMGLGSGGDAKAVEAVERLTWLFGKEWVDGKV